MLMLPYLVTIFVVAGAVGRSRAPAADGIPYIKGCSMSIEPGAAATQSRGHPDPPDPNPEGRRHL